MRWPLLVWLGLLAVPAWSAEWRAEPSVALRQEYNDNINLTALPHEAVWGTILTPSLKLSRNTEVSQTYASLLVNINRYRGQTGLNRNDLYYTLGSNYKTERDIWAGDFSYTSDSTLTSELNQTGVVLARAQHNLLSLKPSWTRQLTERGSVRLSYMFNDSRYSGGAASGLVDYTYHVAAADWLYQMSEKDQLSMTASYSRFLTTNNNYTANTVGLQGGLTHSFSETLQGTLQLGVNQTRSTLKTNAVQFVFDPSTFSFVPVLVANTLTTSNLVPVLSAKLSKQFETGTLTGTASRELQPTGNGSLVETDRLGLDASRSFSEKLVGSANAAVYRSRYIGGAVNAPSSRYYSLGLGLNWRMDERWRLDGGYRYARSEYQNSSVAPTSNLVYATITYAWPESMSR
ncbi:hypothetical protein [Sulfuriferula sp.]|uniref:hypothetical protein n=1 Tax=Sulfuriferula sp. TaxID=2025307 RepID=UPI0027307C1E|nr:hypothetical protein [Sulfuriferula sp.]MDP2026007.1 hypothetical protein [Sulfuriferula sp.]